jgi:DNA replicative helicase MCM subunit Mcm2 (Cdc46/Mcm family)
MLSLFQRKRSRFTFDLSCLAFRQVHLNCLLRVSGVVTRRTGVFPQLKVTKYNCVQCGTVLGPFSQDNPNVEIKPSKCFQCHSKGPFTLNAEQVRLLHFLLSHITSHTHTLFLFLFCFTYFVDRQKITFL